MKININSNKERQVTIISFDKQGKMVMQEMSQTRYFLFNVMKKIIFTILITTFLAIFTSSQATEGKCKITEIVDYSYVHRCEMDNGGICRYTGRDETTITCNF